jgi:hypothetical protein
MKCMMSTARGNGAYVTVNPAGILTLWMGVVLMTGSAMLAAEPPDGKAAGRARLQPGLAYEYFGGSNLNRLQKEGSVPDITPIDRGHGDWSLRLKGLLTPLANGEFTFRAEADIGVRLKINSKLVINGWAKDAARTGKATLAKDKPIPIVVEYFFDREKGGAKAMLRLFWTPPGGKEAPVPAGCYSHRSVQSSVDPWEAPIATSGGKSPGAGGDTGGVHLSPAAAKAKIVVDAELLQKSEGMTKDRLGPYREGLVIYEWRVLKVSKGALTAKKIRVGHWGYYDDLPQDILNIKPGLTVKSMVILPFEHGSKLMRQAKQVDSLPEDFDANLFCHMNQKLKAASPNDRWNYGVGLDMRSFFTISHQLRIVAVGDSRTDYGIDPRFFSVKDNDKVPQAYNLAVGSSGLHYANLILKEYVERCPRVKWVVYGVSSRIFSRHWNGLPGAALKSSPGYKYDQAHRDLLWNMRPEEFVRPSKLTWGFSANWNAFKGDRRANFDAPDAKEYLQGQCRGGRFSMDQQRLKVFENILARLQKGNIRMLAFTPPWHPYVAGAPGTDDDGTSQADYDKINEIMRGLEKKYPNFRLVDINNKANNDFKNEHFSNCDHLNPKGAEKLTKMIDAEIQRLEKKEQTEQN